MTSRNEAACEETPLWPLIWNKRPPRIHVLSDLHLNTAPYKIPANLHFDILVAAGDIGPIQVAVPWLAAVGRPVVYVLGNHEFYGHDVFEAAEEARELAKGACVHVLEQNSVVIQGVRFLGATLWTDFWNWDPPLVQAAYAEVQDYRYLSVAPWYRQADSAAARRRVAALARPPLEAEEDKERFSSAVAYGIHHDTVSWLERELCQPFAGPTVVVTHHAPSRACLTEFGVGQGLLNPANWPRMKRHRNLVRLAAYASPLEPLLARHREKIAAWVYGHLHMHADFLVEGVRVVANARGHALDQPGPRAACTSEVGSDAANSGIVVGRCGLESDPPIAECRNFDRHYVLDLATGFQTPLQHAVAEWLEASAELIGDSKTLLPHVNDDHDVLRYAVRRCFAENLRSAEEGLDVVLSDHASVIDKHSAGLSRAFPRHRNCLLSSRYATHPSTPQRTASTLARPVSSRRGASGVNGFLLPPHVNYRIGIRRPCCRLTV